MIGNAEFVKLKGKYKITWWKNVKKEEKFKIENEGQ